MLGKLSSHIGPGSIFSSSALGSLVLYLDAGNTHSYNGSGNDWFDLSPYHNNGTFYMSPSYSTNWNGNFQFDGTISNNYVSFVGATAIPINDSPYTIEAWASSTTLTDNGGIIGWGDYGTPNAVNALRYNQNGLINYWWNNDLTDYPLGMTPSVFYHIVARYDGVNREIWLNGTMSLQTPQNELGIPLGSTHTVTNTSNLTVGLTDINLQEYLNGGISILKLYNKAIPTIQISNNFEKDKLRFGYQYGSFDFTPNQYLFTTSSDYVIGTNDFTYEAFFYTRNQGPYSGIISSCPENNTDFTTGQLGARISMSSDSLEFWISNNSSGSFITYTVSNDTWYHVAMTRASGTVSCFVNGFNVGEFFDNTYLNNQDIVIGRYYSDYDGWYIDGLISNVRFINGVSIYNSNFTIPSNPLGLTTSCQLLLTCYRNIALIDGNNHTVTSPNSYGWTSSLPIIYQNGLYRNFYDGYPNDNVNYFDNNTPIVLDTTIIGSFNSGPQQININWNTGQSGGDSGRDYFGIQWLGYFVPPTTDTYTFYTSSDDMSYLWIGDSAVSGYSTGNAVVNNGGAHGESDASGIISLTAGVFYPIRIQYGERDGGDILILSWSNNTTSKTQDFTGLIFYNSVTNGF
jgi:GLEYA domain/Concanavalin A-like lectin/glucanases superfamily